MFADQASDLIAWLRSKTLVLVLLREVQASMPGATIRDIKTIVRAVLTQWTMHYQSYRRLRELHSVIVMVVDLEEKWSEQQHLVITGDTNAKIKARRMVQLIKDQNFWHALTMYVIRKTHCTRTANHHCTGWNDILSHSPSLQTSLRQHIVVWTLFS